MPSTRQSFLGHSGPSAPLSHERILQICYAYKKLHEKYLELGGEMTSELYQATLEIEKEIIKWEQRAPKLRYEAKRQAAYRAAKREALAPDGTQYNPLTDLFEQRAPTPTPGDEEEILTTLPSSTQAALDAWKARGSPNASHGAAPDTSAYKKSGLV